MLTHNVTEPAINERAQLLLKSLIERYIREGQPVGSKTLAKDAGLDLSPATVRNVVADLERLGLVRAPHTSAGPGCLPGTLFHIKLITRAIKIPVRS